MMVNIGKHSHCETTSDGSGLKCANKASQWTLWALNLIIFDQQCLTNLRVTVCSHAVTTSHSAPQRLELFLFDLRSGAHMFVSRHVGTAFLFLSRTPHAFEAPNWATLGFGSIHQIQSFWCYEPWKQLCNNFAACMGCIALYGLMFHRLIMIAAKYSAGVWLLVNGARSIAIVQVLPQSQHSWYSYIFALVRMLVFFVQYFTPASPHIDAVSSPRIVSAAVYIYRTSHHMKPLTLVMPSVIGVYSYSMNLLSRLWEAWGSLDWTYTDLYCTFATMFVSLCVV